jgi:predicted ester cyclase
MANKQRYEQYIKEFLQKGDESAADKYIDVNVVTHDGMPGQAPGLEGVKQTFKGLRDAFPDMSVDVKDIIAENDKVVGRFVVSGTNTGSFMGMHATGAAFTYDEIVIVRFKDDKIVEHWAEMDSLGMMQQLGVV